MPSTNRNRPNHRSVALGIITALIVLLLLAAPAMAANTAEYTVSPDGKTVSVVQTFENQNTFYILNPGIFGDSAANKVTDLILTRDDGTIVTPKNNNGTYTFDKGNYILSYTVPIEGNTIYAKYPTKFNVKIVIPDPFTTGHLILGTVQNGGQISKSGTDTIVTYTDTEKIQVTIFEKNREGILYVFLAIWAIVCIIVFIRYRNLKNKQIKIEGKKTV